MGHPNGLRRSFLPAATLAALAVAPIPAIAGPAMTPEAVQRAVVTIDDPLEVEALISSEPAARSTRGLFRTPFNDNHLLAFVHKGTGAVRFEVRQTLNYTGAFRDYRRVNYETAGLPASADLTRVEANQEHCGAFDVGIACLEVVAFEVREDELRRVAEDAGAWRMKFKAAAGREHRAEVSRAEVAGLLRAVDDFRARRLQAAASSSDAERTAETVSPGFGRGA